MTDPLNGLRFDIYERVQLPEDVAAIEELEEIELVPHMQALPQEDNVLLRGHLLLSGTYRSRETEEVSQLEHWIPVEISLPLSRIQSIEELALEIDNFDVDLLSDRSLNVTGVLALRGLQVASPQVPIWRDDSFTVVHQAEPSVEEESTDDALQFEDGSDRPSEPYAPVYEKDTLSYEELSEPSDAWQEAERREEEAPRESSWLGLFQNDSAQRWGDVTDQRPSSSVEVDRQLGYEPYQVSQSREEFQPQVLSELNPQPLPPVEEEKPDVKVALGGKPLEAELRPQSGVGLLSQLGEKGALREAELKLLEAAKAEEKALAAQNASATTGDEIEWTRLFLTSGSETQSFRKVRMCIVQRDDTLEGIAGRYNIQSRELQLYNRLGSAYLSEGQVLYIP